MEQLKYPIGKFVYTNDVGELTNAIERISSLPDKLREAVKDLTDAQLDTPYREGGWTIRQVIHHIPDSHINAYVRCKLAVTEQSPTIKPYDEVKWAECEEAMHGDINLSVNLLDSLHGRWVSFLSSLSAQDLERTYYHPVNKKESKLKEVVCMYAWHGDHHLAHITSTKERKKW